jgi:hypothetical protein
MNWYVFENVPDKVDTACFTADKSKGARRDEVSGSLAEEMTNLIRRFWRIEKGG